MVKQATETELNILHSCNFVVLRETCEAPKKCVLTGMVITFAQQ
jgi:hypothetical protein